MPNWVNRICQQISVRWPFVAIFQKLKTRGTGLRARFWERYPLDKLTAAEWEALCDGCGRCCLLKFEDADATNVTFTNVCCKLLDRSTCRCKHYECRTQIVPDCINLMPKNMKDVVDWLPKSCAYRLVYEGRPLYNWHHLKSGSREAIHAAGFSVIDRCIPEYEIDSDEIESFAVDWANQ